MEYFNSLEHYGDRIALMTEDSNVTYRELVMLSDRIAEELPHKSILLILCTNEIVPVAGYVGALRNGIVPILVNSKVDIELLGRLYNTYHPYAVLCPDSYTGQTDRTILFHERGYTLQQTVWDELPELNEELALLLTTSGSTGSPKLVRQTSKNICSNTESIIKYLGILESDVAITMLPMHYTYGLSIINTHLCVGAQIFLTEKTFFDRDIWDLFRRYRISSFGAVPYTFEMLKRLSFFKIDLPDLRYITQAGGKLSRELHFEYAEFMRSKGKQFVVMYGATEATARMAYLPSDMSVEKAGTIGIPIPGGRFEIIDADDSVITETNKDGELVYSGNNVTPGCAECLSDLAKGDERKGRLETGDIARVDEDGFYMIVGRKSRFLKMFGNRVNLMDVEKLLQDNGWEAACTGQDNHMEIYTTSEDLDGIRDYVKERLKLHASSFHVYHLETIPRNDSGKVLYSSLKK